MTPDRQRLATVTVDSGWSVTIDSVNTAEDLLYDAALTNPDGVQVYTLSLWPSLEAVWECFEGYLLRDGLRATAVALRASAEAEMR